ERAVNLGIVPYLASKFLVLSVLSAVQVLLLMGTIYGTLYGLHEAFHWQVPPPEYCLNLPMQYLVLVVLSMTGVAMGLLLSACVANPDRANALLPYVLIPQIILSGGILPFKFPSGLFWAAAILSPVYWGYRATHLGSQAMPESYPFHMNYEDSVLGPCLAMVAQMVGMLLLTAWFLRRKDPDKA